MWQLLRITIAESSD